MSLIDRALYIDQRVGRGGETLAVPKLRTMIPEAAVLEDLVRLDAALDEHGKLKPDPRITRVGSVLRTLWIDEAPQLALAFSGDLNLVGLRVRTNAGLRRLPDDLQAAYLELGPALIGVAYCIDPGDDLDDARRRFVDSYRRDPARTRAAYVSRFVRNVMRGRFSS